VGIGNITSTVDITMTQTGAWINVVGYVRRFETETSQVTPLAKAQPQVTSALVEAIMIWSAGAVKLDEYEAGVKAMQATTGR